MLFNVHRKFTCNIFYYLLFYMKWGFYLFILPFCPYLKEGKLKFKQYLLHQIICLGLHLVCLYLGITTFFELPTKANGPIGSIRLYQFSLYALVNAGVVVFVINCWCIKPNPYKNVLEHSFRVTDPITRPKYASWIITAVMCTHITITGYPEVTKLLEVHNFDFNLSNMAELLQFGLAVYFVVLFQIAVISPFSLASVFMYCIGRRFQAIAAVEYAILASPALKWQSKSLERLMDYYLTAKELANELNKAFGKMILIVFISVLPSLGFGLSCIFPTPGMELHYTRISDHIRTIHIFTTLYIFALMAANGSSNVQRFTEVAFEQLWKNRSLEETETKKLSLIMQYVKSSCIGIGGVPFFVITYKFIGSMTGAVITYTVLMLQFR